MWMLRRVWASRADEQGAAWADCGNELSPGFWKVYGDVPGKSTRRLASLLLAGRGVGRARSVRMAGLGRPRPGVKVVNRGLVD